MVVDQNFHKVIKYFFSIFFFFLFSSKSFSENFTFKKLVDLNEPWGSSFINNEELIITEKTGKIKIANIIYQYFSFSYFHQKVFLKILLLKN